MAVGLRALAQLAGALDARDQLAQRSLERDQPVALVWRFEQRLLLGRRHLDLRCDGEPPGSRLGALRLSADRFEQLGEGGASVAELLAGGQRGAFWFDGLHLGRRPVRGLEAIEDAEGLGAGDDDVETAVVVTLEHVGDSRSTTDRPRAVVVAVDDPERCVVVEAVADHQPVAKFEDVQGNLLVWNDRQPQLEDRNLDGVLLVHQAIIGGRRFSPRGVRMVAVSQPIDFDAEGLLEGLVDEERASRLALLERLMADGVGVDDLRAAIAEGRLAVLPVELMLAGEPAYTPIEVAERSGVPIEVLERQWRSIGVAIPDREVVALSREDLDAAHRQRSLLDSGLQPDAIAELGRTIAVAMSQFAAATRQIMATSFTGPDDSEREISERIYERTDSLMPLVGPTLDYVYRLHLREQLRHAQFATGDLQEGTYPGGETVTVAFADLVGYTELGEELPPEELGTVTGRLDEVARDVAHGPVRLVKLIGDAAMLASADTEAVVGAVLDLLETMAEEGDGFPLIRAGVARGPVLSRGGDFYGAPVNLASRITGVARPGSVLVTSEVRAEAKDSFAFSPAGRKHLKGIHGTVEVHRCRDLDDEEDDREDEDRPKGSRRRRRRRSRRS